MKVFIESLPWVAAHTAGPDGAGGWTGGSIVTNYNQEGYGSMNQDAVRNNEYNHAFVRAANSGHTYGLEIGPGGSALLTRKWLEASDEATVVAAEANLQSFFSAKAVLKEGDMADRARIFFGLSDEQGFRLAVSRSIDVEGEGKHPEVLFQEVFGFLASSEGVVQAIFNLQRTVFRDRQPLCIPSWAGSFGCPTFLQPKHVMHNHELYCARRFMLVKRLAFLGENTVEGLPKLQLLPDSWFAQQDAGNESGSGAGPTAAGAGQLQVQATAVSQQDGSSTARTAAFDAEMAGFTPAAGSIGAPAGSSSLAGAASSPMAASPQDAAAGRPDPSAMDVEEGAVAGTAAGAGAGAGASITAAEATGSASAAAGTGAGAGASASRTPLVAAVASEAARQSKKLSRLLEGYLQEKEALRTLPAALCLELFNFGQPLGRQRVQARRAAFVCNPGQAAAMTTATNVGDKHGTRVNSLSFFLWIGFPFPEGHAPGRPPPVHTAGVSATAAGAGATAAAGTAGAAAAPGAAAPDAAGAGAGSAPTPVVEASWPGRPATAAGVATSAGQQSADADPLDASVLPLDASVLPPLIPSSSVVAAAASAGAGANASLAPEASPRSASGAGPSPRPDESPSSVSGSLLPGASPVSTNGAADADVAVDVGAPATSQPASSVGGPTQQPSPTGADTGAASAATAAAALTAMGPPPRPTAASSSASGSVPPGQAPRRSGRNTGFESAGAGSAAAGAGAGGTGRHKKTRLPPTGFPYGIQGIMREYAPPGSTDAQLARLEAEAARYSCSSTATDGGACASNWRNLVVWLPEEVYLREGQVMVVHTIVDLRADTPVYRIAVTVPSSAVKPETAARLAREEAERVLRKRQDEADRAAGRAAGSSSAVGQGAGGGAASVSSLSAASVPTATAAPAVSSGSVADSTTTVADGAATVANAVMATSSTGNSQGTQSLTAASASGSSQDTQALVPVSQASSAANPSGFSLPVSQPSSAPVSDDPSLPATASTASVDAGDGGLVSARQAASFSLPQVISTVDADDGVLSGPPTVQIVAEPVAGFAAMGAYGDAADAAGAIGASASVAGAFVGAGETGIARSAGGAATLPGWTVAQQANGSAPADAQQVSQNPQVMGVGSSAPAPPPTSAASADMDVDSAGASAGHHGVSDTAGPDMSSGQPSGPAAGAAVLVPPSSSSLAPPAASAHAPARGRRGHPNVRYVTAGQLPYEAYVKTGLSSTSVIAYCKTYDEAVAAYDKYVEAQTAKATSTGAGASGAGRASSSTGSREPTAAKDGLQRAAAAGPSAAGAATHGPTAGAAAGAGAASQPQPAPRPLPPKPVRTAPAPQPVDPFPERPLGPEDDPLPHLPSFVRVSPDKGQTVEFDLPLDPVVRQLAADGLRDTATPRGSSGQTQPSNATALPATVTFFIDLGDLYPSFHDASSQEEGEAWFGGRYETSKAEADEETIKALREQAATSGNAIGAFVPVPPTPGPSATIADVLAWQTAVAQRELTLASHEKRGFETVVQKLLDIGLLVVKQAASTSASSDGDGASGLAPSPSGAAGLGNGCAQASPSSTGDFAAGPGSSALAVASSSAAKIDLSFGSNARAVREKVVKWLRQGSVHASVAMTREAVFPNGEDDDGPTPVARPGVIGNVFGFGAGAGAGASNGFVRPAPGGSAMPVLPQQAVNGWDKSICLQKLQQARTLNVEPDSAQCLYRARSAWVAAGADIEVAIAYLRCDPHYPGAKTKPNRLRARLQGFAAAGLFDDCGGRGNAFPPPGAAAGSFQYGPRPTYGMGYVVPGVQRLGMGFPSGFDPGQVNGWAFSGMVGSGFGMQQRPATLGGYASAAWPNNGRPGPGLLPGMFGPRPQGWPMLSGHANGTTGAVAATGANAASSSPAYPAAMPPVWAVPADWPAEWKQSRADNRQAGASPGPRPREPVLMPTTAFATYATAGKTGGSAGAGAGSAVSSSAAVADLPPFPGALKRYTGLFFRSARRKWCAQICTGQNIVNVTAPNSYSGALAALCQRREEMGLDPPEHAPGQYYSSDVVAEPDGPPTAASTAVSATEGQSLALSATRAWSAERTPGQRGHGVVESDMDVDDDRSATGSGVASLAVHASPGPSAHAVTTVGYGSGYGAYGAGVRSASGGLQRFQGLTYTVDRRRWQAQLWLGDRQERIPSANSYYAALAALAKRRTELGLGPPQLVPGEFYPAKAVAEPHGRTSTPQPEIPTGTPNPQAGSGGPTRDDGTPVAPLGLFALPAKGSVLVETPGSSNGVGGRAGPQPASVAVAETSGTGATPSQGQLQRYKCLTLDPRSQRWTVDLKRGGRRFIYHPTVDTYSAALQLLEQKRAELKLGPPEAVPGEFYNVESGPDEDVSAEGADVITPGAAASATASAAKMQKTSGQEGTGVPDADRDVLAAGAAPCGSATTEETCNQADLSGRVSAHASHEGHEPLAPASLVVQHASKGRQLTSTDDEACIGESKAGSSGRSTAAACPSAPIVSAGSLQRYVGLQWLNGPKQWRVQISHNARRYLPHIADNTYECALQVLSQTRAELGLGPSEPVPGQFYPDDAVADPAAGGPSAVAGAHNDFAGAHDGAADQPAECTGSAGPVGAASAGSSGPASASPMPAAASPFRPARAVSPPADSTTSPPAGCHSSPDASQLQRYMSLYWHPRTKRWQVQVRHQGETYLPVLAENTYECGLKALTSQRTKLRMGPPEAVPGEYYPAGAISSASEGLSGPGVAAQSSARASAATLSTTPSKQPARSPLVHPPKAGTGGSTGISGHPPVTAVTAASGIAAQSFAGPLPRYTGVRWKGGRYKRWSVGINILGGIVSAPCDNNYPAAVASLHAKRKELGLEPIESTPGEFYADDAEAYPNKTADVKGDGSVQPPYPGALRRYPGLRLASGYSDGPHWDVTVCVNGEHHRPQCPNSYSGALAVLQAERKRLGLPPAEPKPGEWFPEGTVAEPEDTRADPEPPPFEGALQRYPGLRWDNTTGRWFVSFIINLETIEHRHHCPNNYAGALKLLQAERKRLGLPPADPKAGEWYPAEAVAVPPAVEQTGPEQDGDDEGVAAAGRHAARVGSSSFPGPGGRQGAFGGEAASSPAGTHSSAGVAAPAGSAPGQSSGTRPVPPGFAQFITANFPPPSAAVHYNGIQADHGRWRVRPVISGVKKGMGSYGDPSEALAVLQKFRYEHGLKPVQPSFHMAAMAFNGTSSYEYGQLASAQGGMEAGASATGAAGPESMNVDVHSVSGAAGTGPEPGAHAAGASSSAAPASASGSAPEQPWTADEDKAIVEMHQRNILWTAMADHLATFLGSHRKAIDIQARWTNHLDPNRLTEEHLAIIDYALSLHGKSHSTAARLCNTTGVTADRVRNKVASALERRKKVVASEVLSAELQTIVRTRLPPGHILGLVTNKSVPAGPGLLTMQDVKPQMLGLPDRAAVEAAVEAGKGTLASMMAKLTARAGMDTGGAGAGAGAGREIASMAGAGIVAGFEPTAATSGAVPGSFRAHASADVAVLHALRARVAAAGYAGDSSTSAAARAAVAAAAALGHAASSNAVCVFSDDSSSAAPPGRKRDRPADGASGPIRAARARGDHASEAGHGARDGDEEAVDEDEEEDIDARWNWHTDLLFARFGHEKDGWKTISRLIGDCDASSGYNAENVKQYWPAPRERRRRMLKDEGQKTAFLAQCATDLPQGHVIGIMSGRPHPAGAAHLLHGTDPAVYGHASEDSLRAAVQYSQQHGLLEQALLEAFENAGYSNTVQELQNVPSAGAVPCEAAGAAAAGAAGAAGRSVEAHAGSAAAGAAGSSTANMSVGDKGHGKSADAAKSDPEKEKCRDERRQMYGRFVDLACGQYGTQWAVIGRTYGLDGAVLYDVWTHSLYQRRKITDRKHGQRPAFTKECQQLLQPGHVIGVVTGVPVPAGPGYLNSSVKLGMLGFSELSHLNSAIQLAQSRGTLAQALQEECSKLGLTYVADLAAAGAGATAGAGNSAGVDAAAGASGGSSAGGTAACGPESGPETEILTAADDGSTAAPVPAVTTAAAAGRSGSAQAHGTAHAGSKPMPASQPAVSDIIPSGFTSGASAMSHSSSGLAAGRKTEQLAKGQKAAVKVPDKQKEAQKSGPAAAPAPAAALSPAAAAVAVQSSLLSKTSIPKRAPAPHTAPHFQAASSSTSSAASLLAAVGGPKSAHPAIVQAMMSRAQAQGSGPSSASASASSAAVVAGRTAGGSRRPGSEAHGTQGAMVQGAAAGVAEATSVVGRRGSHASVATVEDLHTGSEPGASGSSLVDRGAAGQSTTPGAAGSTHGDAGKAADGQPTGRSGSDGRHSDDHRTHPGSDSQRPRGDGYGESSHSRSREPYRGDSRSREPYHSGRGYDSGRAYSSGRDHHSGRDRRSRSRSRSRSRERSAQRDSGYGRDRSSRAYGRDRDDRRYDNDRGWYDHGHNGDRRYAADDRRGYDNGDRWREDDYKRPRDYSRRHDDDRDRSPGGNSSARSAHDDRDRRQSNDRDRHHDQEDRDRSCSTDDRDRRDGLWADQRELRDSDVEPAQAAGAGDRQAASTAAASAATPAVRAAPTAARKAPAAPLTTVARSSHDGLAGAPTAVGPVAGAVIPAAVAGSVAAAVAKAAAVAANIKSTVTTAAGRPGHEAVRQVHAAAAEATGKASTGDATVAIGQPVGQAAGMAAGARAVPKQPARGRS